MEEQVPPAAMAVFIAITLVVFAFFVRSYLSLEEDFFKSEDTYEFGERKGQVATSRKEDPKEALVEIIVFLGYESPVCRVFQQRMEEIRGRYPRKIAIRYRHHPIERHLQAYPAAIASECARRQGRFATYHRLLFENQGHLWRNSLDSLAKIAGVPDIASFRECLRQRHTATQVENDLQAGRKAGVNGVPWLLVNGEVVPGVASASRLDSLVRKALAEGAKERKLNN